MTQSIVPESAAGQNSDGAPRCQTPAAAIAYTFLRHTGFILDELSAQGLRLWPDEQERWHWRWQDTGQQSAYGFWAIGEALVDAVIGRYPETFTMLDPDGQLG